MKQEILAELEQFKKEAQKLRRDVSEIPSKRVNRQSARKSADLLASSWVEELRSPLEHTFKLDIDMIQSTSELMKRMHVLSRPNNLKESYLDVLNALLNKFDDKFTLPIKQMPVEVQSVLDLQNLIARLNPDESEYMKEAISCASHGFKRASVVMGWCAVIDRIHKKLIVSGFDKFNSTAKRLKAQSTGKFKTWNKDFNITTGSELQTVFDTDLMVVLEGMGLIDGNQSDRLRTCFQYRNHSAHPGAAAIEDAHLVVFFTDISQIILQNPNFNA